MSETLRQHLLHCSDEYKSRAERPRVAWDCMAAKTWSDICLTLADRVWGMDDETALRTLIGLRDRDPGIDTSRGGIAWYAGYDHWAQMQRIVDPVARENRGYILLCESRASGHLKGPPEQQEAYARYLGINQCVSSIRRGMSDGTTFGWVMNESDEAWALRKRAWIERYHPDIQITGDRWNGDDYSPKITTVGEFLAADCVLPEGVTHWLPAYPAVA